MSKITHFFILLNDENKNVKKIKITQNDLKAILFKNITFSTLAFYVVLISYKVSPLLYIIIHFDQDALSKKKKKRLI